MFELAFVVCLASAPDTCEDRSLWFIDSNAEKCRKVADGQLSKWSEINPLWNVTDWRCDAINNRAASL